MCIPGAGDNRVKVFSCHSFDVEGVLASSWCGCSLRMLYQHYLDCRDRIGSLSVVLFCVCHVHIEQTMHRLGVSLFLSLTMSSIISCRHSAGLRCRSLTIDMGTTMLTLPDAVLTSLSSRRLKPKLPAVQPAAPASAAGSLAVLSKLAATIEEV